MENNLHKMSCSIEFDSSKCIKCTKCVQRCSKNCVSHLSVKGEGKERYIDFSEENPCVYCGQCTLVCPINCIKEQNNIEDVKNILKDKTKIVIVQSAPAVRTSIGEIFKMEHNVNIEKKLNTAYRLLGFNKIFDVNFGADITTIVEADELIERLKENENLPMFTACCPSWVEYVKKYHPELKNNLTTARSPVIHAGIAYKTWWAKKNNIDVKNIIVVSIMPCTSKKHEANLDTTKLGNLKAIDYVLTVRELGQLLKESNIDLNNLEESDADELGEYTGGGAIFGTSGGVMESAIRTAYKKITNDEIETINLQEVRTDECGYKTANIKIGKFNLSIAIVAGAKNIEKILEELKENPNKYQYIEVMNCLGGCIGGGGQPKLPIKPSDESALLEKRRNIIYEIDKNKKKRKSYENEFVLEYLNWLEKDKELKKLALFSE